MTPVLTATRRRVCSASHREADELEHEGRAGGCPTDLRPVPGRWPSTARRPGPRPFVTEVLLILPHYGLLLAVVPVLARLPTRALLPVAALAFAVPSVVVGVVADHGLRAADQPETWGELLDVPFLLGHLVWSGGYPVIGWVGFVLVGLWLARLALGERRLRWQLVLGGLVVTALQSLVAWAAAGSDDRLASSLLRSDAHSNHLAWYVLATGTAVATIGASLLLADAAPRGSSPFQRLGRVMLSAYVLHLAVGAWRVWE